MSKLKSINLQVYIMLIAIVVIMAFFFVNIVFPHLSFPVAVTYEISTIPFILIYHINCLISRFLLYFLIKTHLKHC